MRIHAVVPLKALAHAKSRLAGSLGVPERARLIRAMLEQVVAAAAAAPYVARVSVLTRERALVPRGADHLSDTGKELNSALAAAARRVADSGARIMLIVAADLPFVTAEEIGALAEASRRGGVVAAPDWTGSGTNALAVPLDRGLPTRFGCGSFAAHEAVARAAQLPWTVVRRPGIAYDLDEPAQLDELVRAGSERYAFLGRAASPFPGA